MAVITICSAFGAPQNKVWHCFHCFPIYFPWSDGSFKPIFSLSTFTFIKRLFSSSSLSSPVAQRLKRLPAMQETQVRSLGWEDPLEKEVATHSSILAWRIPWMEEPGGLQFTGSQRVGHDWATSLSLSLSAIRVMSSSYLRLLLFLPAVLIPACDSSSPTFTWCTLHIC